VAIIDLIQTNRRLSFPTKFFIIGIPSGHETTVENRFENTYPNTTDRRIRGWDFYTDYNGNWIFDQGRRAYAYDCMLVVISYVGNFGIALTNSRFWTGGRCYVTAQGPNNAQENTHPMGPTVTVSSGPVDQRTRAFGVGLEFWEIETANSWATPRVAARLLQIKDELECSWWEARYRARITAIRTAVTHPAGELWNKFNGFGRIDTAAAIAWTGEVPPDPFLNNGNVYTPHVV
jgi:hypothetical protein